MASSYTGLGTELMTTGENAGTWGTTTNTNLQIIEQISGGYTEQDIAGGADTTTLSVSDGSTGAVLGHRVIKFTGTITGNQIVTIPLDVQQMYVLVNGTSGAYTVQFKYVSGSGSSVTFAATDKGTKLVYAAADHASNPNLVDSGIGSTAGHDLDGNELTLDADSDTSITASTDDQIDIEIAGADDFTFTANAFNVLTGSHATFADSANAKFGTGNDMLVYHDGSNSYITNAVGALKIATETSGIAVTIGHTTSEVTVADNLTVTGTLTGTLATAAQGTVTSLGTLTTLTVDNIITNGTTIGHTSDTDLLTLTSGVLTVAGELDATTLDISGNADIDGTTNLDAVDIDGAVQLDATLTVGADDQGYDIKFFGDTASAYMLWDTSADDLVFAGSAGIDLAGDIDVDGTSNLDNTDIDGTLAVDGTTISLDATTSLNIDNSNTSNGITIGTATSGVPISIGHTTSEVTINDNLTVTGTLTLGSNAELTEAELEMLDGITAGTVAASKAVVVDSNKDAASFRNVTLTGELDAATGDFSGDVDVDGTLEADAITINGTAIGSIYGVVAGSSSIVTTGALDSGSITSGFGAIDNGTSNIRSATITAETAFVPDSSGGADLGTTALEFNDLFLNDSGSIQFGDDQDTTLVHTDGTGLTLNSSNKLCFRDTGLTIGSNADGDLDIVSDGTAVDSINIESAGGITLDAGTAASGIIYEDDGTEMLRIHNSSSDVIIEAKVQDKDIIFKGDDGGSGVTALTLDMSAGGIATFSAAANVAQQAITSSSNAIAWDASDKPNAYHLTTENTTLSAPTNAVEGAFICIEINFDGSHTFAWNAIFNFAADTAPTTTDTNAKTDIFVFRYNGAIWQEVGRTLNIPES